MRRLVLLLIVGIFICLNIGCSKDCYDCTKKAIPNRIDDVYNPTYSYKTVCSDEEALELVRQGWSCEGFPNPRDNICYSCVKYLYGYTFRRDTVCGDDQKNIKLNTGFKCTEIQH